MDEQQIRSLTITQSASATALPTSAESTHLTYDDLGGCLLVILAAVVMNNVAQPPPLPPDAAP